MVFDFTPSGQFNFMEAFAERIGATLLGDTMTLPPSLGMGSIRRVRLTPDFSLLIHQYVLTEELILRRTATDNTADQVNVLFQFYAGPVGNRAPTKPLPLTDGTRLRFALPRPTSPPNLASLPTVPSFSSSSV